MHPEICKIGSFTVYSYGAMLALAFLVSSTLLNGRARKEHFNCDTVFNLVFFSFIAAILGARVLYVLQNLDLYLRDPREIIMFQHGGLSFLGGLIAGIIFAGAYLKKKRLPVYKTLDLIVPFLALGQAIGRIGCLLNGCCYGRHWEYGIFFPSLDDILIPTQILSSFLLIVIFLILRYLQDKPHWQGQVFFSYLFLYALKRFFVEFLRGDSPVFFMGLTFFQLLCVFIFFIAAAKLFFFKSKR